MTPTHSGPDTCPNWYDYCRCAEVADDPMTPTPEMLRNATPDNLAKLARLIAIRQPLNEGAVSEAIDLCVAAWVADRKRLEEARNTMLVLEQERDDVWRQAEAFRKRLEAAEKELAGWKGTQYGDPRPTTHDLMDADAALAGEKP